MRMRWFVTAAVLLSACPALAADPPPQPPQTPREKVSYGIGVNTIGNLKQQGVEIDLDLVIRGMKDAQAGGALQLSDEEIRIAIQKYQIEVRQKRSKAIAQAADENRKAGEAFLAANRTAEGVVTLPSGLQYKILSAGAGRTPAATDTVELAYRGQLLNGNEFERFPGPGRPSTIAVGAAVPGIKEALLLMPAGSKWKLFVPSKLAYGSRGKPGTVVGPNATVTFDVELLSVR